MERASISEAQAAHIVRTEARRLMVLGALGLLGAGLLYLMVSILWLQRPPAEALTRMVPLVALVGLLAYFFQLPRWVRHRPPVLTAATVRRAGDDEIVLASGRGGAAVSVVLPRGTTGFRRGDEVWVSPDLSPAQPVAVVVPRHVTSPRPVISGRAVSAED